MTPEQNDELDAIACAGWRQGPEEWAVVRVMKILEELFRERNATH